jgi:plasmid replication initiation protein
MTLELSKWFWEGVMMKGGVLSIGRAYFNITGGRERWLYRVARKHAGGAGEAGFAITMLVLFDKSGAEGQYRRFKFEMLKLAEKNELPGYSLSVESARDGEPMIRWHRREPGSGDDGATVLVAKRTSTRGRSDRASRLADEPTRAWNCQAFEIGDRRCRPLFLPAQNRLGFPEET